MMGQRRRHTFGILTVGVENLIFRSSRYILTDISLQVRDNKSQGVRHMFLQSFQTFICACDSVGVAMMKDDLLEVQMKNLRSSE